MKNKKQNPSLDQPATYRIKVPGVLDESWFDLDKRLFVKFEHNNKGLPVSTLTGTMDQAALMGLLRRIYSLGIPLISVNCIDAE